MHTPQCFKCRRLKPSHLVLLVHFDPALEKKLHCFLVFACYCIVKSSPVMLRPKKSLTILSDLFLLLGDSIEMPMPRCRKRLTTFFALALSPLPRVFIVSTSFLLAASINSFSASSTTQHSRHNRLTYRCLNIIYSSSLLHGLLVAGSRQAFTGANKTSVGAYGQVTEICLSHNMSPAL